MKIYESTIEKIKVFQICITEEERCNTKIQEKIKALKEENRISIFTSGNRDPISVLRSISCLKKNE